MIRTATRRARARRRPARPPRPAGPRTSTRPSAAERARSSNGRSARQWTKCRSETPAWRVPSSWPSPRSSRSRSASSKPSVESTSACSRACALSVSSSRGREISRQYDCSAPRPTRPRSWCSWASPKRSASCTIMIVAFGTSTPTSITVVATSTSSSRALNCAISSRRSAGRSRPCSRPTRYSAQLGPPQPLGLGLGRARLRGLGLLDQRADDVRLPACVEVRAQPLVGVGGALGRHPGGDDRLARGRRLRDLGHGEVAVERQRERPRDRRRGHVQDVRRAALRQRAPLLDAEAVLLVDDGDRELGQVDALLDQRVRADHDLRAGELAT